MSMTDRLDVEVERLDSPFAIDSGGPAFERPGAGRAAAADSPAPLNLLWSYHRTSRLRLACVAAVVALAAAGGVAAWTMERARSVSGLLPLVPLTSVSETRVQPEPRRSRRALEGASATSGQVSAADRASSGTTASAELAPSFDARLETILHAPDRAVALIDGQVVQVGDVVRGAKIVEITPNRVLLRDQRGRARRLLFAPPR